MARRRHRYTSDGRPTHPESTTLSEAVLQPPRIDCAIDAELTQFGCIGLTMIVRPAFARSPARPVMASGCPFERHT